MIASLMGDYHAMNSEKDLRKGLLINIIGVLFDRKKILQINLSKTLKTEKNVFTLPPKLKIEIKPIFDVISSIEGAT